MSAFSESVVDDAALVWLETLGYPVLHGPDIVPTEPGSAHTGLNHRNVVLPRRLRQALSRLSLDLPRKALDAWLAVERFTVSAGDHTWRPDVVLFVNGSAVAVVELANPADANATMWSAFQKIQTYQAQLPALFVSNAVVLAPGCARARSAG